MSPKFSCDVTRVLLYYLPLKEKVRFERVSKAWGKIVLHLLEGQTSLGHEVPDDERGRFCPKKSHRITGRDLVPFRLKDQIRFPDVVQKVLRKCPNLEAVAFYGIEVDVKTLPVDQIWTQLRTQSAFGLIFGLLVESCPKLECICFEYHSNHGTTEIRKLDFNSIWSSLSSKVCPNLKHIRLPFISEETLNGLIRLNPGLEAIYLDGDKFNVNQAFDSPVFAPQKLVFENTIDVQSFRHFSTSEAALWLQHLDLSLANSSTLDATSSHFLNLRTLKFAVTYDFEIEALRGLKELIHLKQLEAISYVNLSSIDDVLGEVLFRCSKLRRLSLKGFLVTDLLLQTIDMITPDLRSFTLIRVEVEEKQLVSDKALLSLGRIEKLSFLDIDFYNHFTADCFISFLSSSLELRYVRIEKCRHQLLTPKVLAGYSQLASDVNLKQLELVIDVDPKSKAFLENAKLPLNLCLFPRIGFEFKEDCNQINDDPGVNDSDDGCDLSLSLSSCSSHNYYFPPQKQKQERKPRNLFGLFSVLFSCKK